MPSDPRFQGFAQDDPVLQPRSRFPDDVSDEQKFRNAYGDELVNTAQSLGESVTGFAQEALALGAQTIDDFNNFAVRKRSELVQGLIGGNLNQPSAARAPSEATRAPVAIDPNFALGGGPLIPPVSQPAVDPRFFGASGQGFASPQDFASAGVVPQAAPPFPAARPAGLFPAVAQQASGAGVVAPGDPEVQVFTSDGRNILVPLSQAPADARAVGPYVGADPNFNPEFDHEAEKANLRQAGRRYIAEQQGVFDALDPRVATVPGAPAALLAAAGQNGAGLNEVGSGTPLFPPPGGGGGGGFSLPEDVISRLADSNIFGSLGAGLRKPGFLNGLAAATQLMAATKQRNREATRKGQQTASNIALQEAQVRRTDQQAEVLDTATQQRAAFREAMAQTDGSASAVLGAYAQTHPLQYASALAKRSPKDVRTGIQKDLEAAGLRRGSPAFQKALQRDITARQRETQRNPTLAAALVPLLPAFFAGRFDPVEGDTDKVRDQKARIREAMVNFTAKNSLFGPSIPGVGGSTVAAAGDVTPLQRSRQEAAAAAGGQRTGGGQSNRAARTPAVTPAARSPAPDAAAVDAPLIPHKADGTRDLDNLVKGRLYKTRDGSLVRWNGSMFDLVKKK